MGVKPVFRQKITSSDAWALVRFHSFVLLDLVLSDSVCVMCSSSSSVLGACQCNPSSLLGATGRSPGVRQRWIFYANSGTGSVLKYPIPENCAERQASSLHC